METNIKNPNTKILLHKALLFLLSDTISHQNKDEEMSSGHFDSEAQRERRTEHFGLLNLLPTKTRIKTNSLKVAKFVLKCTQTPYPTKTRIMTCFNFSTKINLTNAQTPYPTKTRIKTHPL